MILYALIERKMHHSVIILESYIKKIAKRNVSILLPAKVFY